jgi:hypothetical protein
VQDILGLHPSRPGHDDLSDFGPAELVELLLDSGSAPHGDGVAEAGAELEVWPCVKDKGLDLHLGDVALDAPGAPIVSPFSP